MSQGSGIASINSFSLRLISKLSEVEGGGEKWVDKNKGDGARHDPRHSMPQVVGKSDWGDQSMFLYKQSAPNISPGLRSLMCFLSNLDTKEKPHWQNIGSKGTTSLHHYFTYLRALIKRIKKKRGMVEWEWRQNGVWNIGTILYSISPVLGHSSFSKQPKKGGWWNGNENSRLGLEYEMEWRRICVGIIWTDTC